RRKRFFPTADTASRTRPSSCVASIAARARGCGASTSTRPPTSGWRRRAAREPRWWTLRHAQNLKPATYRCPLCDGHLHAMTEHVLIAPEGDLSRRRHAHTECAAKARAAGRLPSWDEWQAMQPRRGGLFGRLLGRGRQSPKGNRRFRLEATESRLPFRDRDDR